MTGRQKPQGGGRAPLFSIIVPCWNAQATLAASLNSVLLQDCNDWELIVVDDGSTDATPDIIDAFCMRDKRVQSLRLNQGGPSNARNVAGLSVAKGKYLAFLDGDDLWRTDKLSMVRDAALAQPEIDGFYAQIAFFRETPLAPETYSTVYPDILKPIDLLRDNPVCTMSNLVITAASFRAHGGFNIKIVHNEDVELLVRMTAAGVQIKGINENLVSYRTSITGLSANLQLMRAGWYKAVDALQATSARLSPRELAEADAGNLRYLARRALRTGAPGFEALRFAAAGLRRSPTSFFNPIWRGSMTLLGSIAAPLMPKALRALAFSR